MTNQTQILVTTPTTGICLVTLNRPEKRNALNGALIQEWINVLTKIAADKSIQLVMFNGNGEHFCAGADIAWMQKVAQLSYEENVADALQLALLLNLINTFPKPTIGLIHGSAMGGGLGVMACCDIVIAADNTVFCFSETKIGLTPSVISPYVIPVIGARSARYYYLTAEKFDVKKALELNLVQQSVSLEKLFDFGIQLAKTLLNNSPYALQEAKKLIRCIEKNSEAENIMEITTEHLAMMRSSDDAREGLQAFLEKRMPLWKGM
jgi:methylglutaconyl-CoA hydratase